MSAQESHHPKPNPAHDATDTTILIRNTEPSLSDLNLGILKDENTFLIIGPDGNIRADGVEGLFINDMRHIAALNLVPDTMLRQAKPGTLSPDRTEFTATLTAPDGGLTISNRLTLFRETLYRVIGMTNTTDAPRDFRFRIACAGGWEDMFALRGPQDFAAVYARHHPDRTSGPLGEQGPLTEAFDNVTFSYTGIDNVPRASVVRFSDAPDKIANAEAFYSFTLNPGESRTLYIEAGTSSPAEAPCESRYNAALSLLRDKRSALINGGPSVTFANPEVQSWWDASMADMALLTDHEPTGLYPCAGLPWFSTKFGRDGIITAMFQLWNQPDYAAGVLRYLARHQADASDPETEAEPGKIMHETRQSETVTAINPDTGKPYKPFSRYYSGVDTTMLFVMLAGQYFDRTGDAAMIEALQPNVDRALDWIINKITDDGFIGYTYDGDDVFLGNQQWMDSRDSLFYENGDYRLAYPRKELTVQAYAYQALLTGARLAQMDGSEAQAQVLQGMAADLHKRINDKFWLEDKGAYAHAVDGNGVLCPETKSSAGHVLFTGIASTVQAQKIAATLLDARFNNGGGIRTLHNQSVRYDPEGYHNGSVWPHDNALIAEGFSLCGQPAAAKEIIAAQQRLAVSLGGGSLPELVAGDRAADGGFVKFPSACHPQAWATAAMFKYAQIALGLNVNAPAAELRLDPSAMPPDWGKVTVNNLPVGESLISFEAEPSGTLRVLSLSGPPVKIIDSRTGDSVEQLATPAPAQAAGL